jgi:hypothetical protein
MMVSLFGQLGSIKGFSNKRKNKIPDITTTGIIKIA